MEIENIIYLVIGVGWFLWNAYRKSQATKKTSSPKTTRQVPVDEPASEHFKSLEDMILEQFGEKQTPKPVVLETTEHKNQDKFLSSDLTHSHLADDYEMSKTEMKSHRVKRQVRVLQVEENEEESLIDQIMPNGFDLRQAVVMNAVLDRPYS